MKLDDQSQLCTRSSVRIHVYHYRDWPWVAPIWSELVQRSKNCSVFLTPVWVETWIEIFGAELNTSILTFESHGEAIGACLLSHSKSGPGILPVQTISLNTSGEPTSDTVYTEFNDLLCLPEWEARMAEALSLHIVRRDWDELKLEGFCPGPAYLALVDRFRDLECREVTHPAYYVDLARLRCAGETHESALGRASRKRLRQNIRSYSQAGQLRLEAATDLPAALAMLEEMAGLSRRTWSSRGGRSIFCSERFLAFHRRLIEKSVLKGGVQLLRVTAGQHLLGIVYNLAHEGRVYFYQCGYNYPDDKRLSPGLVTLSYAIQYCLGAGFDDYDFLSGFTSYKQRLSTGGRTLIWAALRRPSVKLRVLDGLRSVKQRFTTENYALSKEL